jgi:hypothetical protein
VSVVLTGGKWQSMAMDGGWGLLGSWKGALRAAKGGVLGGCHDPCVR